MIKRTDIKTFSRPMLDNGRKMAQTYIAQVTVTTVRHVNVAELQAMDDETHAAFTADLRESQKAELMREVYGDLPTLFAQLRSMAMCHVSPGAVPTVRNICEQIEYKLAGV